MLLSSPSIRHVESCVLSVERIRHSGEMKLCFRWVRNVTVTRTKKGVNIFSRIKTFRMEEREMSGSGETACHYSLLKKFLIPNKVPDMLKNTANLNV